VNVKKIELAFITNLNFVKNQGQTACGLDWTDVLKKRLSLPPFLISSWMRKKIPARNEYGGRGIE